MTKDDSGDTERLRVTLEESRRTFDKQIATMEEIDDKAMRTVRTSVLIVGFVVSALGIAGTEAVEQLGKLPLITGGLGVLSLILATLAGVGVYSVTEYPLGVGSDHRWYARMGDFSDRRWLERMLNEYNDWSADIRQEIERNSRYLSVVQWALMIGIGFLVITALILLVKAKFMGQSAQTSTGTTVVKMLGELMVTLSFSILGV